MRYITLIAAIIAFSFQIGGCVRTTAKFERDYQSSWDLADKSSTISAKRKHIDSFYDQLEMGFARGEFSSNDAIIFPNPNNSFKANLDALKTLKERLAEVEQMDPKSFEYNTAIQQITEQEQGEAGAMISNFGRCYLLSQHPVAWDWIGGIFGFSALIAGGLAIIIITHD